MSQRQYLKDIAYEKIKYMVIQGEIKGPTVSENELVELLQMSRTPIREALQRLHNEDFLEVSPKRGIFLKEITVKETHDIMDMRLAIELYALERVEPFFREEHLAFLDEKIKEQEEYLSQNDIFKFIQLDLEYHALFLRVFDNEFFVKTLNNISDRLYQTAMIRFGRDISRAWDSIEDHKQINALLREEKFQEVRDLMEKHILKGKEQFFSH
ncbi:GntR family transcriptional regulator [Bacillus carboniphilus]|uniref:GntR family transcriptional regulator n=1 Tax=Bacillus carboniphilus TaxID=86663 RepID=A0ABN0VUM8_9BACI